MNQKFLFNYVSPGLLYMPSAAFSVLKSYLEARGISCKVYYWNLKLAKLQSEFLWIENMDMLSDETNALLLYFNYLSIRTNDKQTYNKIKGQLMTIKPQFIGRGNDLFDKHMKHYAEQLDKTIDELIEEVCSPDITYYGFSANLYQWVCSSIIATKIKAKYPQSIIILGGIGTKNAAVKYLKRFSQFDFTLWGEGECSLYSLISSLEKGENQLTDISNLAYREDGEVLVSVNRKVFFSDLSSLDVRPDYHDYFIQKKENEFLAKIDTTITIEGSRGCHWNRCHFCYLNTGYKNRSKSVDALIDELKYNIKEFRICKFNFLDNDTINNDYERFNQMLDQFIELKREFPDFKIGMAEIITKDISADIIKKMALAGFELVQIGYESPSNNILRKIDKKNTFASNFLFIKYAALYRISIGGANVIFGLLEETDDDIIEAIYNFHTLRFCLDYKWFRHNYSSLSVSQASRYYKKIDLTSGKWRRNMLFDKYLPSQYMMIDDEELDIIDVYCTEINSNWGNFKQVEDYYLRNKFTYNVICNGASIIYKEYFNDTSINEIEFESESLDWYILRQTNSVVQSFDSLYASIKRDFNDDYLEVEVINIIEDLKDEGLIYTSEDYVEIVSVINVNMQS